MSMKLDLEKITIKLFDSITANLVVIPDSHTKTTVDRYVSYLLHSCSDTSILMRRSLWLIKYGGIVLDTLDRHANLSHVRDIGFAVDKRQILLDRVHDLIRGLQSNTDVGLTASHAAHRLLGSIVDGVAEFLPNENSLYYRQISRHIDELITFISTPPHSGSFDVVFFLDSLSRLSLKIQHYQNTDGVLSG